MMPVTGAGLTDEARRSVVDLARVVDSLRPLAEAGYPLRIPGGPAATAVTVVAAAVDVPLSVAEPGLPAGRFDALVAALLGPHLRPDRVPDVSAGAALLVAETARGAVQDTDVVSRTASVAGTRVRTYAAGEPGRPAVVLASACGMPAALCRPWMRFLSTNHHVVTWETRGLFGELGSGPDFDALACDLDAQAADLLAVMDHYDLPDAHLMGLCGGAVIALSAAARRPERVTSLSLWHGDFSGTPGPTTNHQDNLKALMGMAVRSRADAAAINDALAQTTLAAVPARVAHLVVYPYASAELFYRYCVLTGATMSTDISDLLPLVHQPALVVTSEDDHTAHPGGSHQIAARLPRAALHVEPHGDHISVFGADPRLQRILTDFLRRA